MPVHYILLIRDSRKKGSPCVIVKGDCIFLIFRIYTRCTIIIWLLPTRKIPKANVFNIKLRINFQIKKKKKLNDNFYYILIFEQREWKSVRFRTRNRRSSGAQSSTQICLKPTYTQNISPTERIKGGLISNSKLL